MIYACAFWPSDPEDHAANMKKTYGFADSKQLTEEQREKIFEKIKETQFKDIGFFTKILSADYLSNKMLADWDKGGKNLNKISHDSAIELILKVRDVLGF
jgi:ribonuclease H2 subunit A